MAKGPKYPNQQLRSVSLEAYFPGRLGAIAAFGEVQKQVADRLPLLFVPNVLGGEALALRPFQLRNAESTRSLALALNQVAYIGFDYPGFATFGKEAIDVIASALRTMGVTQLSRLVHRYENDVGIAREKDGTIPLKRVFPKLIPDLLQSGSCRELDALFEHDWDDSVYHGTQGFHARVEQTNGSEALRVSVHASVSDCTVENLSAAADKAHEVAFALFESLISDEFRKFISMGSEEV